MISDGERIVGDYLRGRVDARVAGQLPRSFTQPWVRLTQLDASDRTGNGRVEHLVNYLFQLDCYAGSEGGQAEASLLSRSVREHLVAAVGQTLDGTVISSVEVTGHARIPDDAFEPARERYVVTTEVTLHVA